MRRAPTVWVSLLAALEKEPGRPRARSLRKAFYGASIMPVPVPQRLRELLPGLGFYNCFGQSEIGPLATVLRPEEHDARPASAGRAIAFVDMRVVDDDMRDVSALPAPAGGDAKLGFLVFDIGSNPEVPSDHELARAIVFLANQDLPEGFHRFDHKAAGRAWAYGAKRWGERWFALSERKEYIEPEQVEAAFQALRPRLLGALLYSASRGLRDSSSTKAPKGVRMAGAARWALASAPAGGFTHEEIADAFAGAIEEADQQVLDHPLVVALQDVVIADTPWSGKTKDLLAALTISHEARVPATGTATKRLPKKWPENPQALRSELRRLAKTLTRSGFTFVWPTGAGRGGRVLTITRATVVEPGAERTTPTTTNVGMSVDNTDDADENSMPDAQPGTIPGTIPGTMGTMPSPEAPHRSPEENRLGNDGNDGNDPFLKMEKEKEEELVEGGEEPTGCLLPENYVDAVQIIVPIVPPFPHRENGPSGGTMPNSASFPAPPGIVPPSPIRVRAVWATDDGERLTVALLAAGEPDDADPSIFHFRSVEGVQAVLDLYGWTGHREADGILVGFAHEVYITTREHTFGEGRTGRIVSSCMRVADSAA